MENSDIISKDIAFLGHGSKMASIKHCFDKNVLICRERRRFLLPPILLSFYFGPCISLAIYFSFIELSNVPLFARILLFLAVTGSWILFVAMMMYHKTIIIDFSSKSLLFVKKVWLKKQYRIDLSQIVSILSRSVQRVNSDSTGNVTTCHYFTIILIDHTKIRMCETTKKEELNNMISIIRNNCGHAIEWQDDQTVYRDNKLEKLRKHT